MTESCAVRVDFLKNVFYEVWNRLTVLVLMSVGQSILVCRLFRFTCNANGLAATATNRTNTGTVVSFHTFGIHY